MIKPTAAALLGATLTVAVYEGRARITSPESRTVTVTKADGSRSFSTAASPPNTRRTPATRTTHDGAVLVDLGDRTLTAQAAADTITALEEELAALKLERDLQAGALEALEGTPHPFPDNLPADFQEAGLTSHLESLVGSRDDLSLVGVDCEEYPCMAILQAHTDDPGWMNTLAEDVTQQLGEQEHLGLSVWVSQSGDDGNTVRLAGVAVRGDALDGDAAEALDTRANWRMDGWLQDTTEAVLAGDEPTQVA